MSKLKKPRILRDLSHFVKLSNWSSLNKDCLNLKQLNRIFECSSRCWFKNRDRIIPDFL